MPNNMIGGKIYPTNGKNVIVDVYLNKGLYENKSIYIHYTSERGFYKILTEDRLIKGTPDKLRRSATSKVGVYLTPSNQCFSKRDAHTLLFFEEEKYKNSATHIFLISFKEKPELEEYVISQGNPFKEIIYRGDIDFKVNGNAKLIFAGVNNFLDGNPWN